MTTAHDLYRLVYVSRSVHGGDPARLDAEVADILTVSRRNNQATGVTGALLFNSECFAQTLEGSMEAVAATFERIQCDPRHRETVILQARPVASRDFGDWSMAYAGRVEDTRLRFGDLTDQGNTLVRSQAAESLLEMMRGVILRAEAA